MSMLDDIAAYLATQSVGTVGTNIFIGQMPDSPDICISLHAYGGQPPDEITEDMEYPGLQVMVRGAKNGFAAGFTMGKLVETTLHGLTDTTLTTTYYYRISANQSVAQMGFDANDRPMFVINFSVTKEVT